MNTAYIYLQLYRMFDRATPAKSDCGTLCDRICCRGDEGGMYLFPGEKSVYRLLDPDWIKIEQSDFCYSWNGTTKYLPIAFCNGECDRYQRPLACRIFPLTPVLDDEGKLQVIVDPRAKPMCPLAKVWELDDFEPQFITNVERSFRLLLKNREFYAFMQEYTKYIKEFCKFF